MIPCDGNSVITLDHKHGNALYRCTMANAKKLLAQCLANEGRDLNAFAEQMKTETRPVRPAPWLIKALAEVVAGTESPERLRIVLHGGRPRDGEDQRPTVTVTKEMQDELVLFCFRNSIKLDAVQGQTSLSLEMLATLWRELSFLEGGRARVGADILFVEDYLYEGYEDLKVLLKDNWKETAKEENVVANYYCRFFNTWASGRWSVEPVADA